MSQNRVTQEQIDDLISRAETQELVISFRLPNGFTVSGRGACVDPKNFDIEIGRRVATEDAKRQLWQLEGYVLQNQLWAESLL